MSTSGLNDGCEVTSSRRCPSIHTSRPSRIESRYSVPVHITVAPPSLGDLRQDDLERVIDVLPRARLRGPPVPLRECRKDQTMTLDRLARFPGVVLARDAVVEVVLPAGTAQLQQPGIAGGGDHAVVEALVQLHLRVGVERERRVA